MNNLFNLGSSSLVKLIDNADAAWLNLHSSDLQNLVNPLIHRSQQEIESPELHLLRIMRNPKYFWLTCKYLLNVELLPVQATILEEMWYRPFPMLIAARGFGKALAPNEKIRVQNGWKEILLLS